MMKGVKKCISPLTKLVSGIFVFGVILLLGLFINFVNVSAANYPIAAFALYGQQTYGSSNSWVTELPYSGSSMHSVYRWRVYTGNISTQNAGRYAGISISGFINIPIDFITTLNQGLTITECSLGGTSATLSDITASWTFNAATQDTPPQILYSAESTLDFGTNDVSGNLYCTLSSNNGVYFLQHSTTGVGTVSFGTTNFNVNFANTLSEELLQTQVNQNQTIIDQNNQDRQDFENQSDDSSDTADDLSNDVSNASSSLLTIIGNFVNIVLNPPQSDCNITLDVGNANFGQADLCRLSLPQPLVVLSTLFIIGFILTFTISLIMTFLNLLKGATQ